MCCLIWAVAGVCAADLNDTTSALALTGSSYDFFSAVSEWEPMPLEGSCGPVGRERQRAEELLAVLRGATSDQLASLLHCLDYMSGTERHVCVIKVDLPVESFALALMVDTEGTLFTMLRSHVPQSVVDFWDQVRDRAAFAHQERLENQAAAGRALAAGMNHLLEGVGRVTGAVDLPARTSHLLQQLAVGNATNPHTALGMFLDFSMRINTALAKVGADLTFAFADVTSEKVANFTVLYFNGTVLQVVTRVYHDSFAMSFSRMLAWAQRGTIQTPLGTRLRQGASRFLRLAYDITNGSKQITYQFLNRTVHYSPADLAHGAEFVFREAVYWLGVATDELMERVVRLGVLGGERIFDAGAWTLHWVTARASRIAERCSTFVCDFAHRGALWVSVACRSILGLGHKLMSFIKYARQQYRAEQTN